VPERTRRSSDRAIAPRPAVGGPRPPHARRAAPWPAIAGTPCPGPCDPLAGGTSKRSHRVGFAGHGAVRPAASAQNHIWAERFIKTLLAEWAYGRLYRTNAERLAVLPSWVHYYNAERTHTALGGITPMAALANNLRGNHN
jgi:hypothetical protein